METLLWIVCLFLLAAGSFALGAWFESTLQKREEDEDPRE